MKKHILFFLLSLFTCNLMSSQNDTTICENLGITSETYPETEDLNQKVKDEFGDSYTIADWNDLKNMTNVDNWISCLGLKHDDTFLVTKDGNYFYNGNRQYLVHYSTDGLPYSGFLVHDQVGDFYLGSWYGLNMNILAKKERTYISDSNFEQALIDLGIISDNSVDGSVTTSEISAITSLDISGRNISDLTGIEDFTSLETLIVSNNQLTSLNLSYNNNLILLEVSNNPLTTIVLTNDDTAKSSDNKDSQQAVIAPNNNIFKIDISETELVTIDISNTPNLEFLNAQGSKFTFLDISNNGNLDVLNITNNPITCVQVSQTQLDNIPTGWEKDATAIYNTDCQSYLGIDDELLADGLKMYPNPVSDILTIHSDLSLIKVEIYSVLGKKVKEINSDFNSIQTNDLSSGIYIVRMHSEKGTSVRKLIKQ